MKGANAIKERLKECEHSQCDNHEFHCVSPAGCGVASFSDSWSIMTGLCYHGVSTRLAPGNILTEEENWECACKGAKGVWRDVIQ